ncbi:MAG TPA: GNAT family N-acetyltransferase [Planctomycetaceae bacterium]|nr:GNAT family N-acetyltransferase [Planctomycetaceae bacterium]
MRPEILTIRASRPEDAAGIELVRASAIASLRKTYRPTQKAIAHKQAISTSLTQLVALCDGRVIGSVEYRIEGDRVHFLSLDVHLDSRRQGVARRLLAELDAIGKRRGATRLSTYTVTQTGNVELFRRLAFRVVSEEPTDLFESDQHAALTESYLEREIR